MFDNIWDEVPGQKDIVVNIGILSLKCIRVYIVNQLTRTYTIHICMYIRTYVCTYKHICTYVNHVIRTIQHQLSSKWCTSLQGHQIAEVHQHGGFHSDSESCMAYEMPGHRGVWESAWYTYVCTYTYVTQDSRTIQCTYKYNSKMEERTALYTYVHMIHWILGNLWFPALGVVANKSSFYHSLLTSYTSKIQYVT